MQAPMVPADQRLHVQLVYGCHLPCSGLTMQDQCPHSADPVQATGRHDAMPPYVQQDSIGALLMTRLVRQASAGKSRPKGLPPGSVW